MDVPFREPVLQRKGDFATLWDQNKNELINTMLHFILFFVPPLIDLLKWQLHICNIDGFTNQFLFLKSAEPHFHYSITTYFKSLWSTIYPTIYITISFKSHKLIKSWLVNVGLEKCLFHKINILHRVQESKIQSKVERRE